MKDFYSSILGVPVAGATLSVIAFGLLAVYGKHHAWSFGSDFWNRVYRHPLKA